jgi:hypothetical protein
MRKLILTAVGVITAAALPTAGMAQGRPELVNGTFENRGQCEAAVAQIRNTVRRQVRDLVRPNETNEIVRENVRCERLGERFILVIDRD